MQPSAQPRYEYRVWGEAAVPAGLPRPAADEPFADEVYLLPLGLLGHDIKLRGDALEIKDLLLVQDGLQLWRPAARLEFPIPTHLVERELMVRLMLNQVLRRPSYTREALLQELAEARENIAVVPVQKRRRLFEIAGCRAETGELVVGSGRRRFLTAAVEHEDRAALRRAMAQARLDRHPNLDYPTALFRLLPLR